MCPISDSYTEFLPRGGKDRSFIGLQSIHLRRKPRISAWRCQNDTAAPRPSRMPENSGTVRFDTPYGVSPIPRRISLESHRSQTTVKPQETGHKRASWGRGVRQIYIRNVAG